MKHTTDTFTVRVSYKYDPLQAGSPEIEEIEALVQEAIQDCLKDHLESQTVTDVYDVEIEDISVTSGVYVARVSWE